MLVVQGVRLCRLPSAKSILITGWVVDQSHLSSMYKPVNSSFGLETHIGVSTSRFYQSGEAGTESSAPPRAPCQPPSAFYQYRQNPLADAAEGLNANGQFFRLVGMVDS